MAWLLPADADDQAPPVEPETCTGEPDGAEPFPEPFAVAVCGTCRGAGSIVDVALTESMRAQLGRVFTVSERCPSCAGSGGLVVKSA